MTKITQASIARNIPEFAREEYPLFVKLMEEYYRYLDTTYSGDVSRVKDIDTAPEEFIEYFKKQFAINISSFWNIDFKKFLFFAKSFYSSRGTESSIRFLFRAMFGEEIEVDYPGRNVLRVSDGKWRQEFHIEVKTLFGTFPIDGQLIEFSNDHGEFLILPTRIEIIPGTDRCFIFFEQPYRVHVDDEQKYIQRNTDGVVIYAGRGIASSSKITIESPGKYWQTGSVIRIPGSIKDTFARVSKTTPEGAIDAIEILEFGYDHVDNQAIVLSPFPNRPIGSAVDINSEIINTSPLAFHHTIDILDYTDGSIESIRGISTEQDFFLGDFFLEDFFGKVVINKSTTDSVKSIGSDSLVTIDQWLESRATLVFGKSNIVRDRGYYLSADSLISNNEVRLHDSFYYQAFSYVVETERELREYKESISLTHPAGLKFFALMNREVSIDISPVFERIYGVDMINRLEVQEVLERIFKNVAKPFEDSTPVSELGFDLNLAKNLNDLTSANDESNIEVTKLLVDVQMFDEESNFEFTKLLVDNAPVYESHQLEIYKPLNDVFVANDAINKETWKKLMDSISLGTESSFIAVDASFFNSDYFLANYFSPTTHLEIQ